MFRSSLFLLALGFYTRLPVPKNQDYSQLAKASLYLPLIGWLVGGLSGLCFYAANLLWSQTVAVILSLSFGILLTGAFHEDGFADVCDGFGGGYGKQRILEIMKDSQVGTYGALGLLLMMFLKINLLSALPESADPSVIVAGHSLSRFSPLLLMFSLDYARNEQSKGSAAVYKPDIKELFIAGSFSLLPLWLLPPVFCLAIPLLWFINWQLGRYFFKHIGGYTGDCLGASQQLTEVVFYLSISALWIYT
jgi:adenosylcobinamide-GDP ribazoletransferase